MDYNQKGTQGQRRPVFIQESSNVFVGSGEEEDHMGKEDEEAGGREGY